MLERSDYYYSVEKCWAFNPNTLGKQRQADPLSLAWSIYPAQLGWRSCPTSLFQNRCGKIGASEMAQMWKTHLHYRHEGKVVHFCNPRLGQEQKQADSSLAYWGRFNERPCLDWQLSGYEHLFLLQRTKIDLVLSSNLVTHNYLFQWIWCLLTIKGIRHTWYTYKENTHTHLF